jgi:hypothetical protein
MVTTKFVLLIILLGLVVRVQSPPTITVCSTFCATNNCLGWTMSDCNPSNCYTGWTYSTILQTCDFANTTNFAVMAFSDDQGGDITVTDHLTGCNCLGSTYYYGNFVAS